MKFEVRGIGFASFTLTWMSLLRFVRDRSCCSGVLCRPQCKGLPFLSDEEIYPKKFKVTFEYVFTCNT